MPLADILSIAFFIGLLMIPLSGLYLLLFRKKTKEDYIHEMKILSIVTLVAVGIPFSYRFIQQYVDQTQAAPDTAITDYQVERFADRYEVTLYTAEPVFTYLQLTDVASGEATIQFPTSGYQELTTHVYVIPRTGSQVKLMVYLNSVPAPHPRFPLLLD